MQRVIAVPSLGWRFSPSSRCLPCVCVVPCSSPSQPFSPAIARSTRGPKTHHVIVKAGLRCRVGFWIIQVDIRVTILSFLSGSFKCLTSLIFPSAILIGTPVVIGVTAYYFWPKKEATAAPSEGKKIVKTAKIKPNTRNSIPEPVKLPPQVEAKNEGNVCFKVRALSSYSL